MRKLGGIVTTIAAAILLMAVTASPSDAASRTRAFDGLWSVSINTQNGSCPASLRYPVAIVGGQVQQAEADFSYQITGVVVSSGAIAVIVQRRPERARLRPAEPNNRRRLVAHRQQSMQRHLERRAQRLGRRAS